MTITATSSEYTLGRPRITDGKTDPGADNAVLVSPSFMLASQLGAVVGISNENAQDELDAVADHCKQYVEVGYGRSERYMMTGACLQGRR